MSLVQLALGCWLPLGLAPVLLCVSIARIISIKCLWRLRQGLLARKSEHVASLAGKSNGLQALWSSKHWQDFECCLGQQEAGAFSHEWANVSCQNLQKSMVGLFVAQTLNSQISGSLPCFIPAVVQRHLPPLFGGLGT